MNIEKNEKLIFLDVDGVLNTELMTPKDALHTKLLERLSDVVNRTGAKLVLSSTWRLHTVYRAKLLAALARVGIDSILVIGDTPRLPLRLGPWPPAEQQRSAEIYTWISENCPNGLLNWCAIDDLNLLESAYSDFFMNHFVRTTKEAGLSQSCAIQLHNFLCGDKPRIDDNTSSNSGEETRREIVSNDVICQEGE